MTEEDISTESPEAYGIQQIIQLFIALVYSVIIDLKFGTETSLECTGIQFTTSAVPCNQQQSFPFSWSTNGRDRGPSGSRIRDVINN